MAEGATLDYEAKSSYTGKVKWTVNGQAAEVNLTINLTDVSEPPLAPVNPRATNVNDNGFTLEWDAPDNTGRPAITEFEIKAEYPDSTVTTHKTPDGTTYSITLKSLSPGTTYNLKLKTRNDEGDSPEVSLTTTTTDSRPRSADFTKYFKVGENANFSQRDFPFFSDEDDDVLAHIKFSSSYPSAIAHIRIPSNEGSFKVGQSQLFTGQLIAARNLDNMEFHPNSDFDGLAIVRFKVVDHEDDESGIDYAMTLKRVANIPPSFGVYGPLSREIPENTASGTALGAAVAATDPDTGDTLTYSLSGTDASYFSIDSGTGQISVAAGTVLDYEAAKNTYEVKVGVSDGKTLQGVVDTAVDALITVNIAVTNVDEGRPPAIAFSLTEATATTMKVTVTPPDTSSTSPIKFYIVSYRAGRDFTIQDILKPFETVFIESGTTVTLTGLTPSTTYYVKVMARNLDERVGPLPEPDSKTATTLVNNAPTSAELHQAGFPPCRGDLQRERLPIQRRGRGRRDQQGEDRHTARHVDRNQKNRRQGELRLDGKAVTAGQLISVDDLGKLKYVPQPDGFRVDVASPFTFKVLDKAGAESPTYTVTMDQIPDIVLSLSPSSITESSTPSSGGRVTVTGTLTGPARTTEIVIPQILVNIVYDAREDSDYTVNTPGPQRFGQQLRIPAGQKSATVTFDFTGIEDNLVEGDEEISFNGDWGADGKIVPVTERVAPAFLTLEDNDRAVVSITGPPGEVEEGEDAVFTVALSRGITKTPCPWPGRPRRARHRRATSMSFPQARSLSPPDRRTTRRRPSPSRSPTTWCPRRRRGSPWPSAP